MTIALPGFGVLGRHWRPVLLALIVGAVLVLVWVTARGRVAAFPDQLLQAVGLLLTALVFVLSLAQSRLTRAADAVADSARRSQEVLLTTYLDRPGAVTTMELWERAGRIKGALFEAGADVPLEEGRRILHEARRRVSNWGTAGSFDRSFDIAVINRELDRTEEDKPSPRRRRYLEREKRRILHEDRLARAAAERAGVSSTGYRRLTGRARVAELSVKSLLKMAWVFIAAMLGLVALGAIYSGSSLPALASVEMWSAAVLLALAGVYVHVVRREVDLEIAAMAAALRDSSLVALLEAESGLLGYVKPKEERDTAYYTGVRDYVESLLEQAEDASPGLPWVASVRGRLHLVDAIEQAALLSSLYTGSEGLRRRLLEDIRPARRLLDLAASRSDDPVAALAQARLLCLEAELLEQHQVDGPRDLLHAVDPKQLRRAAAEQTQRAVALVSHVSLFGREAFWSRPYRLWITDSPYLLPDDDSMRSQLATALPVVEKEGTAGT